MFEKLEHAGLTHTEAKIYLMLLDLGKGQAGVLSRKTGIHRRSIYDALDRLIEKGLVSYIVENGKRYYFGEDPKRIQEIIDRKQEEITEIMGQLHAKFIDHKEKQETTFYRGREGLKSIFEDQIAVGKDVHIIGASRTASEMLKFYLPHYTNKRKKKKIKLHCIYSGERKEYPIPLGELRYLPKKYDSIVSTNIYGEKVAIIIWLPHDPAAIVIRQKDVAQTFRNYFDLLWELGEK